MEKCDENYVKKILIMRRRAEEVEATLKLERAAFEEAKECLEDDLSRALITQDMTEAHEQVVIDQCQ